jgi:HK97 family phage major capsid protein
MISNQEQLVRLKKAAWGYDDLNTGGGLMNQAYAKEFVELTVKESVAMKDMMVFPTPAATYKVPNLSFSGTVLYPGVSGAALPDAYHSTPDAAKVEYVAKLYKAKIGIPDEIFEDNVEEEKLKSRIQGMLADKVRSDWEWVVFEGDTASADPTLAVQDGLFKQATSHTKDAGGATLSLTILKSAWKLMPSQFRAAKRDMRTWCGANPVEDYGDSLMDRQTTLGDDQIKEWPGPRFKQMPVMDVPLIAENLGGGSNYSHALTCHPKNATVGVWKDIQMEPERDADAGIWNLIIRLRFGVAWAEENGVVEITNLLAA